MVAVTNKEIPDEFNLLREIFTMYKKFYHPEVSNEYWTALVEYTRDIIN